MNYTLPVKYSTLHWTERKEVRLQYIREQQNKCLYCQGDLSKPAPESILSKKINWNLFPKNFLQYPVHLQHCHKTDLTEGAVHNYCNAVMWQYDGR